MKVYHLTAMENIDHIRREGILSRAEVEKLKNYTDIAEHRALNNHRNISIYGVSLDNYARCFFNPLPPMYYNRKNEGFDNLAIIELHIPVEKVTKMYAGSMREFHNLVVDGARFPRLFRQSIASHLDDVSHLEVHNLNQIHWNADKSAYLDNKDVAIACRGAELLVYPKIPAKYIYKIYDDALEEELECGYELGHPEIGDM